LCNQQCCYSLSILYRAVGYFIAQGTKSVGYVPIYPTLFDQSRQLQMTRRGISY